MNSPGLLTKMRDCRLCWAESNELPSSSGAISFTYQALGISLWDIYKPPEIEYSRLSVIVVSHEGSQHNAGIYI